MNKASIAKEGAGVSPASIVRIEHLIPIRYGRMSQSPFAFFRGSAGVMAADLAGTPATGLRLQFCGDCELRRLRHARAQHPARRSTSQHPTSVSGSRQAVEPLARQQSQTAASA